MRGKHVTILIYVYDHDVFKRMEGKKEAIELAFGAPFDWYSSRKNSTAKRIVHKHEADIYNEAKQQEIFEWMIEAYDRLYAALESVGE